MIDSLTVENQKTFCVIYVQMSCHANTSHIQRTGIEEEIFFSRAPAAPSSFFRHHNHSFLIVIISRYLVPLFRIPLVYFLHLLALSTLYNNLPIACFRRTFLLA